MIYAFCIILGVILIGFANTYYWYRKTKALFEQSKREGLIDSDVTWEKWLKK